MIKIFKLLKIRDYLYILVIGLLVYAQVYLDLKLPEYVSEISKLIQSEGTEINDILVNGGWMMLCAFGSLIIAVITGFFTSKFSANLSMGIRNKIYKKISVFSLPEIKKFSVSSLITRTTNDITQVQMFTAMGMQMLMKAPLTAFLAIIKISTKNYSWSLLTIGAIVILLIIIVVLMIVVIPKFKLVQKFTDRLNEVTKENLSGIRVVRAFNAEKYQEDKFSVANDDLTNLQLFNQKAFALMQPIMFLIMNGLSLGIYYIGANLIENALLPDKIILFGDMVVFGSYAMQIISAFLMLAFIFMVLPRASVSINRINEVLETKLSIKNGTLKKSKEVGTIEFKNVSFKYDDAEKDLLSNINFKINNGDTFAIVGSTGSGKSTLINLIPRLYDVSSGEVLVDGINVKEYDLEYLNDKIGFVTQKAILFNGTVSTNVSLNNSNSSKSIEEAIEVSQAKEFVEKMDDKYNSFIASGGTNISGGQKQRLSIARAIAKKPEIYIFDDSFSALDYKTDSLLRKELKKYTKGATTLIVAQRIGTIMKADKILVLDEGKIVGLGTHKELLKTCEVYKQIAYSQLTKEELENE